PRAGDPGGGHRRAAQAAIRPRPLHRGGDEHRGVVDPLAAAGAGPAAAAAGVDLVAVVLVVGDPVDVVEVAVVVLQGVVVVVPELLQPLLLGAHALVAVGEDVPAWLVAAVRQRPPAGPGGAAAQGQGDDRAGDQG